MKILILNKIEKEALKTALINYGSILLNELDEIDEEEIEFYALNNFLGTLTNILVKLERSKTNED